jgi:hypothetical protein
MAWDRVRRRRQMCGLNGASQSPAKPLEAIEASAGDMIIVVLPPTATRIPSRLHCPPPLPTAHILFRHRFTMPPGCVLNSCREHPRFPLMGEAISRNPTSNRRPCPANSACACATPALTAKLQKLEHSLLPESRAYSAVVGIALRPAAPVQRCWPMRPGAI